MNHFIRTRLRACGWLAFVALSACGTLETPPLLEGKTAVFAEAAPDVPSTSPTWWKSLDDPTLDALIEVALIDNLSLQAATLRLAEARDLDRAALWSLAPKAGLDIRSGRMQLQEYKSNGVSMATPNGLQKTDSGGFNVSWELPLFGKAQAVLTQGSARLAQAHWQLEAAKVAVAAEVVRTYAQWQNISRALGQQQENIQAFQLLEQSELAVKEGGFSTDADVGRVLQQRLKAEADVAYLGHQQAQLEARLSALLGGAATPELPSTAQLAAHPLLPVPEVGHIEARQLRLRPDLRAAEQTVALAAAEAGVAQASLWPQFSLGGDLTVTSGKLDAFGFSTGSSRVLNLTSALHIPLLDWFYLKAQSDAKFKEMQAVVFDYRQTVVNAWEEARVAYSEYLTAQAKEALAEADFNIAAQEVKRQEALHQAGYGTTAEVLKARLALRDKEIAMLEERFSAIQAWAKLVKATFVSNA